MDDLIRELARQIYFKYGHLVYNDPDKLWENRTIDDIERLIRQYLRSKLGL